MRRALADARTGSGLVQALEGIPERTTLSPLARFVDRVAVAVERGTPLADVLRAQAATLPGRLGHGLALTAQGDAPSPFTHVGPTPRQLDGALRGLSAP